jgi:hypothetical protein
MPFEMLNIVVCVAAKISERHNGSVHPFEGQDDARGVGGRLTGCFGQKRKG